MTQALRTAVTGKAPATQKKGNDLASLMADPKIKAQMSLAMPKHMTADRLARVALTEMRKNPQLAQCDQLSFMGAIMQCAQLGLEPGGALGHAYMIPFRNNKKNIVECQFILGYRGMLDLARRSGQVQSIEARAVFEGDQFDVTLGLDSNIVHKPNWDGERKNLRFVYAVVKLVGGGTQFEVMSRREIEKVRASSKGKDQAPWQEHFEEMAKKTVIRRMFKYLPISIEMSQAVGLDEQGESENMSQDNPFTIDSDTGEIVGGPEHMQSTPQEQEEDHPPQQDFVADMEAHEQQQ